MLSTLLLSVIITSVLITAFSDVAVRIRFVDVPDERKQHGRPVPVVGGLAMAFGALVPVLYWQSGDSFVNSWIVGSLILVGTGLIDDFRGLSPKAKFAGQVAAALVVIVHGDLQVRTLGMLLPDGVALPVALSVTLTLVAVVGVTNAINLADGLDGLAGGVCLLTFCAIGYLSYQQGISTLGFITLALGGAIFGFLKYNTFPATVFMGDTGSQFLGFSAITLSLNLTQRHTPLSPLLPLLLLGLPVLDTLFVFATRIARGSSPFAADRTHFHHRLMGIGLHHAESVLVIYFLQIFLVICAYLFRFYSDVALLSGYFLFSAVVLSVLINATRIGARFKRYGFFDTVIKRHLRELRDQGIIIRHTFRWFETGLPLLLIVTCLISPRVPALFSIVGLLVAVLICAVWRFKRARLESVLRPALYILIPFAVYLSESSGGSWLKGWEIRAYNALFALATILTVIISKFSRRQRGFKSTPMDFLILFLALVFQSLPDANLQDLHTGQIAAKIIILFFCFEALLAELRGEVSRVAVPTVVALGVLAVKGLLA